jgi:hypothetical protein
VAAGYYALKTENEVMKIHMHERHPEFLQAYAKLREEAISGGSRMDPVLNENEVMDSEVQV